MLYDSHQGDEQSQNILEVDSGTVAKYHIKKRDKIVFTEKNP